MIHRDPGHEIFLAEIQQSKELMARIGEDCFCRAVFAFCVCSNSLLRIASNEVMIVGSERRYSAAISGLREKIGASSLYYVWFLEDHLCDRMAEDISEVDRLFLSCGWRVATSDEENDAYQSRSLYIDDQQYRDEFSDGLWKL